MANKETAGAIWEKLELSLDALYQQYKAKKEESRTKYETEIAALAPVYGALKTEAAAQNRIAKSNFEKKVAESGLSSSGEALRRSTLQDAALQQNLTALSLAEEEKKAALSAEARREEAALSAEESKAISDYTFRLSEAYLEEADREAKRALAEKEFLHEQEQDRLAQENKERELALKAEQQAFEQRIKEALNAAQIKSYEASAARDLAAAEKSKSETKTEKSPSGTLIGNGNSNIKGGDDKTEFVPSSLTPKALVEQLASEYTVVDKNGQASHDYAKLRKSLRDIIANTMISAEYRYEVYLYAEGLGYL